MMGGNTPAPKMPDPIRMPSPDDPELLLARRRKMQEEFAGREGRASTQLGPSSSSSPVYGRTTLG